MMSAEEMELKVVAMPQPPNPKLPKPYSTRCKSEVFHVSSLNPQATSSLKPPQGLGGLGSLPKP